MTKHRIPGHPVAAAPLATEHLVGSAPGGTPLGVSKVGKGAKGMMAKAGKAGHGVDETDPSQVHSAALAVSGSGDGDPSGQGGDTPAQASGAAGDRPADSTSLADAAPAAALPHHGGGSIAPYLLGGLVLLGGGAALAGGKGGGASTTTKTPASVDTPSLALANDSGASSSDGVTNRGTIAVSSLQTGAKWEYSVNSGTNWTAGSGSSFILPEGSYAAGAVQVRQTDAAGTVSAAGKLTAAVTVDTSIAAPTVATVAGDDVLSIAEAGNAAGVTVTGTAEANASVTLSWKSPDSQTMATATVQADAGGKWSYTFTGAAIPDAKTLQQTTITATATDVAGNVSDLTRHVVATDPGVTVTGTITAGAVIAGNDLTVSIYTGAGKLLASGVKVGADGTFSVANLAVAANDVLIATLGNGPAADYADEASGASRNLSASLLAVGTVSAGQTTLNINPLTTLAALSLGLSLDDKGVLSGKAGLADTTNANQAVSSAFGLGSGSVATLVPAVYPAQGYPAGTSLTAQQKAGVVLAALSGLDLQNAGETQQTIAYLAQELTLHGDIGSLSDSALSTLMGAAAVGSIRLGTALATLLANQLALGFGGASGVTIDVVAGDNVINSAESKGLTLTGALTGDATSVKLQLGNVTAEATLSGNTWSYALSAADAAKLGGDGGGVLRVSATFADGSTAGAVRPVLVALSAPAAPAIDKVLGDDLVSRGEQAAGIQVTGHAEAGATVAVTWNGTTHSVTADPAGAWSASFASAELPQTEGTSQISAAVIDRFGNTSAPAAHAVTLDFTMPDKPVIDPVAGFDLVSAAQAQAGVPVSGTAEPGARVLVGWVGGTPHEVAVDANGHWSTTFGTSELPADGLQVLSAFQIDAAGNTGPGANHPVQIAQFVQGLVVAPIAGGDGVNRADAERGIVVAGAATPGSKLLIEWDGADPKTVTADARGYWSVTYAFGEIPADGTRNLTVSGIDADGIALTPVSTQLALDTQPPAAPKLDPVAGDAVVNKAEKEAGVAVSGHGEAGSTVTVSWGDRMHTDIVSASGTWSVTFADSEVPVDAATSQIVARLTDTAGNASLAAATSVAIRTTTPTTPVLTLLADTGANTSDGVTRNGTIQVAGLLAGGSWEYTTDGGGSWTAGSASRASFTLGDDSYARGQVRVRQVDAAGNASPEGSIAGPLTIKSAPPVILLDAVTEDGKVNAAEKTAGVTISGTIANMVDGIPVQVTVRWADGTGTGGTSKTVDVQADGTWTASFAPGELPAADGRSVVVVNATDGVDNRATQVSTPVEIKTATPAAPTVTLEQDSGIGATDGITNDPVLLVTGVLNQRQWEYSLDGGVSWQAGGEGNGRLRLDDGTFAAGSIRVRQIDEARNPGAAAVVAQVLTIDTATTDPTIDPVGNGNVINAALRQQGVTLTGHAEAGAAVRLTVNGTDYGTTADAVTGQWSLALRSDQVPTDGDWPITVHATDRAGNNSAASGTSVTVTVDTRLPAAPTIAAIAGDDVVSGAERSAGVTVTGHTEAGTAVRVSLGSLARDATVMADGSWSVTFLAAEVPADAAQVAVSAIATNARANASQAGQRLIEIDTGTATPTVAAVAGNDVVNAGEKAVGLAVSGTAEAGAVVTLKLGDATVSATAAADGSWAAQFAAWQLPADGIATLSAQAIDLKGNVSTLATHSLRIDTSAPAAPTLGAIAGDNIVTVAEAGKPLTLTGKAEAGSSVALSVGGTAQTVTMQADGTWSALVTLTPGAESRDVTVTAIATDAAGNVGPAASRTALLLGTAQTGPVIAPVTADDRINAAEKAAGVRISGLASPNSTVDLAWAGKPAVQVTVGANGLWTQSFAAADLPADGLASLTATVDGQATTRSVLIDTQAPVPPVVTDVTGAVATTANLTLTGAEKASGIIHIAGTSEADAAVQITWAGVTRTVQADAAGHWSTDYLAGQAPADGATAIRVVATDVAGNTGSAGEQTITVATAVNGTASSETLTGVGNGDVVSALGGNDLIIVPDLAFRMIDGGAGTDTLKLAAGVSHATLDLTHLAAGQLVGVEAIDLSGGGANGLVVDAAAIQADTGGANRLIVTGTADESVTALGFAQGGTTTDSGHTYAVYTSGSATLWVDQTIQHVVL